MARVTDFVALWLNGCLAAYVGVSGVGGLEGSVTCGFVDTRLAGELDDSYADGL